jgi:hypothetical protein
MGFYRPDAERLLKQAESSARCLYGGELSFSVATTSFISERCNTVKLGLAGWTQLRASTSRPSGEWNDDDFDVLADGVVVGPS